MLSLSCPTQGRRTLVLVCSPVLFVLLLGAQSGAQSGATNGTNNNAAQNSLAHTSSAVATSTSSAPVEKIDFEKQVWPIIEGSCLLCHDRANAFSNLRLDSPERILEGGDLGKVVVPGEPDNSPLVVRVALPDDDLDFMPIEGDPLTEKQIEILRQWIEEGADFGDWKGIVD